MTKKVHPDATHAGHRPRSFDTVAPFMLDEVAFTLRDIRRARASADSATFGERHTASNSAVRLA